MHPYPDDGTTADHLPARLTPGSPAAGFHADGGRFGARNTPLAQAPAVALAFALGYACARPQHANSFGPFCAVVEELQARRGAWNDARDEPGPTHLDTIMAEVPPELASAIMVLYQHQRGQRWSHTGSRGPQTGAQR